MFKCFYAKFGVNNLFDALKWGVGVIPIYGAADNQVGRRELDTAEIANVQTLAPNDVTRARWQHQCLGYFGFTFVQWEEEEALSIFIQAAVIGLA